jgi:hypothetical protein
MLYHLLIKNEAVVDGRGVPRPHGDVGNRGRQDLEIGKMSYATDRAGGGCDLRLCPISRNPR